MLAGVVPLVGESISQDAFEVADHDTGDPVELATEITDCNCCVARRVVACPVMLIVVNCICDREVTSGEAGFAGRNWID